MSRNRSGRRAGARWPRESYRCIGYSLRAGFRFSVAGRRYNPGSCRFRRSELPGRIAGYITENGAKIFLQQVNFRIHQIRDHDVDRLRRAVVGIDDSSQVKMIVLYCLNESAHSPGRFVYCSRPSGRALPMESSGKAEVFCISFELQIGVIKGIGDIHRSGKQPFESFIRNKKRSEVPDIDLMHVYMHVVPVPISRRMRADEQLLFAAGYFQRVGAHDIFAEQQFPVFVNRPGFAVDVESGRIEFDLYPVGQGLHLGRHVRRI